MTENAIRVQLPGGARYAPALHEAAAKTGARSGLSKPKTNALNMLVQAAVAVLNSGNAVTITLEMHVHEDAMSAKLTGKGCSTPTKKLTKALESLAAKKAKAFESTSTKAALTMNFEI